MPTRTENLTKIETKLILSISDGSNYARKIYNSNLFSTKSHTIIRQLNILKEKGWLKKEKDKDKIKQLYSVKWDVVVRNFIDYLVIKSKGALDIQKFYFSLKATKKGIKETKLTEEQKEFIQEGLEAIKEVKQNKENYINILGSYFSKEVFPLLSDEFLEVNMKELFEIIIIGMGNCYESRKIPKRIKDDPILEPLLYLCSIVRKRELFDTYDNVEENFTRFIKSYKKN